MSTTKEDEKSLTKEGEKKLPKIPYQVVLDMPLTTPSGVVSTLTFRRGKARDMVAAQTIEPLNAARRELVLMSMLSEEKVVIEDLEELDFADLAEVQATFQSLFLRAP
jgi:hypothetical protein